MGVCLRVLKENKKSRFDIYSVRKNRNSLLIISHITFLYCRVHMFSDNLSRNSCVHGDIKVKPKTAREMGEPVM